MSLYRGDVEPIMATGEATSLRRMVAEAQESRTDPFAAICCVEGIICTDYDSDLEQCWRNCWTE